MRDFPHLKKLGEAHVWHKKTESLHNDGDEKAELVSPGNPDASPSQSCDCDDLHTQLQFTQDEQVTSIENGADANTDRPEVVVKHLTETPVVLSRHSEAFGWDTMEVSEIFRRVDINYHHFEQLWRVKKKNRTKVVRVVIQIIALIILFSSFVYVLTGSAKYVPYDLAAGEGKDKGFISIAYTGVGRLEGGSGSLIDQNRLREQIECLKHLGYVTVSQQDLADYYDGRKILPEKALLLIFEDGSRETAIYAQKILEDNNYLATIMTFADKLEKTNSTLLSPQDIKILRDSTFWEVGSNGYRMEYINVFDRYRNFFGALNTDEFFAVSPYIDQDYNHYLMDYIRDEDRLQQETPDELKARIDSDYNCMWSVYSAKLGEFPKLYALIHANTGRFGTDPLASYLNQKNIMRLFRLNLNREGSCYNSRALSPYDITRMMPQTSWYNNHLIMRISNDTGQLLPFVVGDERAAQQWNVSNGAAEFRNDTIVLTSNPGSYGTMSIKDMNLQDIQISVVLGGNMIGSQGVGLRADSASNNAVYVGIENNKLIIREIKNNVAVEIYNIDLFLFDGGPVKSLKEDERDGLVAMEKAVLKYDDDSSRKRQAREILDKWISVQANGITESDMDFVPAIHELDRASRKLDVALLGSTISVSMDDKVVIRNMKVNCLEAGGIYLESSALTKDKYNKLNPTDEVYDGVYTNLTVTAPGQNTVIYEYRLNFWQSALINVRNALTAFVNFFI